MILRKGKKTKKEREKWIELNAKTGIPADCSDDYAAAMIISVIPFPEGLFHVTAAAAVKMSATWTAANSTLTDSDDARRQV